MLLYALRKKNNYAECYASMIDLSLYTVNVNTIR